MNELKAKWAALPKKWKVVIGFLVFFILYGLATSDSDAAILASPDGQNVYEVQEQPKPQSEPFYLNMDDDRGTVLMCRPFRAPTYICVFGTMDDVK